VNGRRDRPSGADLAARLSGRATLETAIAAAGRRASETSDWVDGVDALLHAHAGEAALLAFLSAVDNGDGFGAAGMALADICRETNARMALAATEAWQRFGRPRWWPALTRLAREAPESFALGLNQAGTALAAGAEAGFANFVAVGLKAGGADPERRRRFFALEDPLARRVLSRGETDGFAANERHLAAFVIALLGRVPFLRPFPVPPGRPPPRRVSIADGVILFPESFPGVPAETIKRLYQAAAAHAAAHRIFGPARWKVGSLKPIQIALIGLMEDARVEALAMRRFPGLRRLWAPFHVARPEGGTAPALLARMARALFEPGFQDSHGFVVKAQRLFDEADMNEPAEMRAIGGLIGNDLGQMRVQFNARDWAIEPAYRDDNLGLWDFEGEAPQNSETIDLLIDAARVRQEEGDGRSEPSTTPESVGRARPKPASSDESIILARYPEWDRAHGVERLDWTCVRATPPKTGDAYRIDALLDRAPDLRRRVHRLARSARAGRLTRLRHQAEGHDLDIDALVEDAVRVATGDTPDGRVYRANAPRLRDLATVVLIDVSESTREASVLEMERLAVSLLGDALGATHDPVALLAFASDGRERVGLTRVKDFDEPFGPAARSRLAGLEAGLSTRLGAALRHAGAELQRRRASRRLVLVMTDAEPSDIDVTDPLDLVEDAARAIARLKDSGVDVLGIVMGEGGAQRPTRIFGRSGYVTVARPTELPTRFADLYFRLSRR
jgi:nitric oxide reductase NorD protein